MSCKEYLSDSYVVKDVSLGKKPEGVMHENELMPSDDPQVVLQQLINHGNFKFIHCRWRVSSITVLTIIVFRSFIIHYSSHHTHHIIHHSLFITSHTSHHITHITSLITHHITHITSHSSHHNITSHHTLTHPADDKDDGYLYYTPSSLPYNPTAPLRNTIPLIPLEISDAGVHVSNIVPQQYVNPKIRRYIEHLNATRTPQDVEEMRLIKEKLQLKKVTENLMMLGSVLDDDKLDLSSDEEEELPPQFKASVDLASEEYKPHYPPRTLKEIYSLPHKNRGDLKEGLALNSEEIANVMNMVEKAKLSKEELDDLLQEGATAGMSDVWAGAESEA